jgi:hypothetical protein
MCFSKIKTFKVLRFLRALRVKYNIFVVSQREVNTAAPLREVFCSID